MFFETSRTGKKARVSVWDREGFQRQRLENIPTIRKNVPDIFNREISIIRCVSKSRTVSLFFEEMITEFCYEKNYSEALRV